MKASSEIKKRNYKLYTDIVKVNEASKVFVNHLKKLDDRFTYDYFIIDKLTLDDTIEGNFGDKINQLLQITDKLIDLKIRVILNIEELTRIRNKKMNKRDKKDS